MAARYTGSARASYKLQCMAWGGLNARDGRGAAPSSSDNRTTDGVVSLIVRRATGDKILEVQGTRCLLF